MNVFEEMSYLPMDKVETLVKDLIEDESSPEHIKAFLIGWFLGFYIGKTGAMPSNFWNSKMNDVCLKN